MSPASSCAFEPRQVPFIGTDAGWSSSVARRAHNPEVAGSNPVPATRKTRYLNEKSLRYRVLFCPDEAESLCYSLPFSQTPSRRRGGGGGAITQHRGLSINAPAGRKTILTLRMFSGKGWRRGGLYRLNSICTARVPPKKAQAVRSFALYFNGNAPLYRLYRLKPKKYI